MQLRQLIADIPILIILVTSCIRICLLYTELFGGGGGGPRKRPKEIQAYSEIKFVYKKQDKIIKSFLRKLGFSLKICIQFGMFSITALPPFP
jgi:hypothetical protein